MPFFQHLRAIEKKYALSFLGFLLAVVFGALAIYTAFYQERRPNLKYEILSNTSVLDIHEQLSKLSILYAGKDIKESGQSLSIMTVRVINDGQQDILKGHYDENDPVGFAVVNGEIVETPEVLHASNNYLQNNLHLIPDSSQKIRFSNVIFERGEFFILKILVLHGRISTPPDILPVGKVAGIKEIEVTRPYKEGLKESFWSRVFGGGWLVQLIRVFSYTALLIALLIVLVKLGSFIGKLKRRILVRQFKHASKLIPSETDQLVFDLFIKKGDTVLFNIESVFLSQFPKKGEERKSLFRTVFGSTPPKMIKMGLLIEDKSGVTVNNEARDVFDKFMEFLRSKGRFSMYDKNVRSIPYDLLLYE